MSPELASFLLDGVIIILLAGTIFYCLRLSSYLKAFRDSRAELEGLLRDLSSNIEKAGYAIEGLRQNARDSGRDLQGAIGAARGLSEELQIMTESGNSLAARLEKLADRTGRAAESLRGPVDFDTAPRRASARVDNSQDKVADKARDTSRGTSRETGALVTAGGFSIRDREHDQGASPAEDVMNEQGILPGDLEEDSAGDLGSRAERELYQALRRRKTGAGGTS